jgi:hypothetical protein
MSGSSESVFAVHLNPRNNVRNISSALTGALSECIDVRGNNIM